MQLRGSRRRPTFSVAANDVEAVFDIVCSAVDLDVDAFGHLVISSDVARSSKYGGPFHLLLKWHYELVAARFAAIPEISDLKMQDLVLDVTDRLSSLGCDVRDIDVEDRVKIGTEMEQVELIEMITSGPSWLDIAVPAAAIAVHYAAILGERSSTAPNSTLQTDLNKVVHHAQLNARRLPKN